MGRTLRERFRVGRATLHRRLLPWTRWVAVTGSVGKTTTAALLAAVFARQGPCHDMAAVAGTNSARRVCGVIKSTRLRHRTVVLEVSAHAGGAEVAQIARIVRPDIAIVTTVANDHRSTFGSLEATAAAKVELVRHQRPRGFAVLNADDPLVWAMRQQTPAQVIGFGRSPEARVRLLSAAASWPDRLVVEAACDGRPVTVRTRLLGSYAVVAVLAALAAALAAGIAPEAAAAAMAEVEPVDGRMCPHETPEGITFVDNAWKSPAHSLPLAWSFLAEARAARKIVVLGSISDYSGSGGQRYRATVREALQVADVVILSGPWHSAIRKLAAPEGKILLGVESTPAAREALRGLLRPGDLVLLQGSSRMDHFDRLVYDRLGPVACWTAGCRLWQRCLRCPGLRDAAWADRAERASVQRASLGLR